MTPHPHPFADRHLIPQGVGQAPSSPTTHGKAVGSSWGDRRPEGARPVTAGADPTARNPRVDTIFGGSGKPTDVVDPEAERRPASVPTLRNNRPTLVIDGVTHTLAPGWSWPARAERTENPT